MQAHLPVIHSELSTIAAHCAVSTQTSPNFAGPAKKVQINHPAFGLIVFEFGKH
jgi:hypothetical protein